MARFVSSRADLSYVTPWNIGDTSKISSLAEAYGKIGWHVTKEQLFTVSGEPTSTYATIRHQPSPNGETRRILLGDKLSDKYEILQNADSLNSLRPLIDAGLEPKLAGSIDGGKKVCVILRFPDDMIIGDDDRLSKWVLYTNDHTGRERARFAIMAVRLVCTNGMRAGRMDAALRIRHKSGANGGLAAAVKCLDTANQQFIHHGETMEKLMGKSISRADLTKYVKQVFFPKLTAEEERTKRDAIFTLDNQIGILFAKGPGSDMPGAKGTAYGAYQAINHHLNHGARGDRQASFLWGSNALVDERALSLAGSL